MVTEGYAWTTFEFIDALGWREVWEYEGESGDEVRGVVGEGDEGQGEREDSEIVVREREVVGV